MASSGDDGATTDSSRRLALLVLLAALGMFSVLCYPMLVGETFLEDDIGAVFIPFRYFYAQALQAGESFIWIPNVYNGFYLQGESQTGMTHPLHYLLYKNLPFTIAFNLEVLLSYPFMFAGAVLFFRRWKLPPHVVLLGALLCTFSGYPTSRWLYIVHIGALAHAPWLLFCIDIAMRSKNAVRVTLASIGVVALTASALLIGYPHIVFIFGLVEGLYALSLIPQAATRYRIGLLLWAKFLALGCAAIQLLPTYDLAMHSVRTAFDYESRMWGSQHPANLLQLVNPYFAHQRTFLYVGYDTFYGGATVTLLVAWLALRYRRLSIPKSPVICFAIAAALGVVLTLGHYGYLYRVVSLLPIFNMFRGAARHGAMFHLAWIVLATLALFELHRMRARAEAVPWKELAPLVALPLLSLGVAGVVAWAHANATQSATAEWLDAEFAPTRNALIGAAIMAAATIVFITAARGWRGGVALLILFTVADLSMYGLRHKTTGDFDTFMSEIETPPDAPGAGFEPDYYPTTNVMGPLMMDYRTAAGRASIEPARALDYHLNETPLRLSGVKWLRTRIGTSEELNRYAESGVEWIEVPAPMPRARLVSATLVSDDPSADVETIDIAAVALVERDLALEAAPPGTLALVEDRPGRLRLRTNTASRQLLILTESYYPGWRVTIDGESAPALQVNGDFLGCVVGPGEHEAIFSFNPDSWRIGKLVTASAILLTLIFHFGLFGRLSRQNSQFAQP